MWTGSNLDLFFFFKKTIIIIIVTISCIIENNCMIRLEFYCVRTIMCIHSKFQTLCSSFFVAKGFNSPPFNHPRTLICRNILACTSTRGANRALSGSVTAGIVVLTTNKAALNAGVHIQVRTKDKTPRVKAQINDSKKPNTITRKL